MTLHIMPGLKPLELEKELFIEVLDYNMSWQQALSAITARVPMPGTRYLPINDISYDDEDGDCRIVNDSTT